MWIQSFQEIRAVSIIQYNIDDYLLNELDSIKDLGVIFENRLTFKTHINMVISKACTVTELIKKPYIQHTLVRPILEYGILIWFPYQQYQIDKLNSM